MERDIFSTTADSFLKFMIEYNSLVRRHIIACNEYRLNSHCFAVLYHLREKRTSPITMTEFAVSIGITKQQLTKLVNDLESRSLVSRSHNLENRRQVHISITPEGEAMLDRITDEIICEIKKALTDFTPSEAEIIRTASDTLSGIFKKDAEQSR